jgi:hypothetical protein
MQIKAIRPGAHYRSQGKIIVSTNAPPDTAVQMPILDPAFWTALAKITGVNGVSSGDNGVAAAITCATLAIGLGRIPAASPERIPHRDTAQKPPGDPAR